MLTWDEDERPPSGYTRMYVLGMRLLREKEVFERARLTLRTALELQRSGRDEHVDLHVHDATAMFHVWMTSAMPEGRRTRRELAELVARRAT